MYFLNEKLLRRCLTLFEQYYEDSTISLHLLDIMTFILRNRFYLYYDQGSKKDLGRRLLTPTLWTQICKIGDFLWNSKNPGHLKNFFDWLCVLMESFLRRGGKNRKQKYYFFVWLNGPAWQSLPRGFLPYFTKSLFSTNFDFPALNSFLQLFLLFDRLCTVFLSHSLRRHHGHRAITAMGRAALRPRFPPAARVSLDVTPASTVRTRRYKLWKPWKPMRCSFVIGGSSGFHFSGLFSALCVGERVIEANRAVGFVLSAVGEE